MTKKTNKKADQTVPNKNMPKFLITNRTSGADLGVYSGATAMHAIAACLRDAGYEATAGRDCVDTDAPGDMNLDASPVKE